MTLCSDGIQFQKLVEMLIQTEMSEDKEQLGTNKICLTKAVWSWLLQKEGHSFMCEFSTHFLKDTDID